MLPTAACGCRAGCPSLLAALRLLPRSPTVTPSQGVMARLCGVVSRPGVIPICDPPLERKWSGESNLACAHTQPTMATGECPSGSRLGVSVCGLCVRRRQCHPPLKPNGAGFCRPPARCATAGYRRKPTQAVAVVRVGAGRQVGCPELTLGLACMSVTANESALRAAEGYC